METVYQKSSSSAILPVIECINKNMHKYVVRWGFTPTDEGYEFIEAILDHRPTIVELKNTIISYINSDVSNRIISCMQYKGTKIWLTRENQLNYMTAYQNAIATKGESLPYVVKGGTEVSPKYIRINTVDDMCDFYASCTNHVKTTLENGWKEKDDFDWTPYESALS